ncbi:MAG TPA: glycosyltransferase family A protein, partial [Chroococcales cyanobacterium]
MSGSVRQGKKDIAVIIPTYDRPERLSNCLQALCDTDESFSRERFEVIVVDDGSSHSLQSIVEQYARRLEITYIRQPNSGPAAARNRGALAADSRYLCFTDDDCLPAKDWLPQLYSRLENAYEAV